MSEVELIERVSFILAQFHRNACYPEATDFELTTYALKIIAALHKAGAMK